MSGTVCVFGSINVDLVCRVVHVARPGETVLAERYERFFGGKGANQAVAAARFGAQVDMVGAVGRDAFGQPTLENLEGEGVGIGHITIGEEPTGCAFIQVDENGENSITVASGANIIRHTPDIPNASVFVTQAELPLDTVESGLRKAREQGAQTILNLAPVPAAMNRDCLSKCLSVAHYLIVNEIELAAVSALMDQHDLSILAGDTRTNIIVTRGETGVQVASRDGTTSTIGSMPVAVVDTTGAGDTFVGVFAAALASGASLESIAEHAAIAASLACRSFGAQSGMPHQTEVQKWVG